MNIRRFSTRYFYRSRTFQLLLFLFDQFRSEASILAGIVGSMLLATIADLFLPIVSGRLVDSIATRSNVHALHDALVDVAVTGLLGGILLAGQYLAIRGVQIITIRLMTRVAKETFWRVQRFSSHWYTHSLAGAVVRSISRGIWAIDQFADSLLLALFPALLVLFGTAISMGLRWPLMGCVVVIGATIYVCVSAALSLGYVAPAASLSNALDSKVGGAMVDAMVCNSVVKAFAKETQEDLRLARVVDKWGVRASRTWLFSVRSVRVQMGLLLALRVIIALYVVLLWRHGAATPGDLTFVLTGYALIHSYLRNVGLHVVNLQRSLNDMQDIAELHRRPLDTEDRPDAEPLVISKGKIIFEQVTFGYKSHSSPLFDRLSLDIQAGESVGIVGYSGSGKSSFLKLLHGLYSIEGGRILIDDQEIASVTKDSLRSQIAVVPQEPILFHRSIAENIAYARPESTTDQIEEAAHLAHAHDFINTLPDRYRTLVGERGIRLSGGERQRIAIARAFLVNAPILLLDEATSNLDSQSEELVHEAIKKLMHGRTTIAVTHRFSTVKLLNRILVFHRGAVIEEGTYIDLLNKPQGIFKALFQNPILDNRNSPA